MPTTTAFRRSTTGSGRAVRRPRGRRTADVEETTMHSSGPTPGPSARRAAATSAPAATVTASSGAPDPGSVVGSSSATALGEPAVPSGGSAGRGQEALRALADPDHAMTWSFAAFWESVRRSGALRYSGPPLVFLLFIIIPAWSELDTAGAIGATVLSLVFGGLFLFAGAARAFGTAFTVRWLVALWISVGALALLIGPDVGYVVMFVLVAHGVSLPWKAGIASASIIGMAGLVLGIAQEEPVMIVLDLAGTMLALGLASAIHRSILEEELEVVQRRNAVLAVSAERERIGRDIHDILGHSLTTITVSAQLAQRLVRADPDAAAAQIAEIERISRQSLGDIRATARGMQHVRVAGEVASARSVLTAAGVDAELPVAIPVLPDDRAELFGYVVREAVTNVVRHARASTCRIEVSADEVRIVDDGVGIASGAAHTGLDGLRCRVEEAGGQLRIGPADGGGTLVEASMHDGSSGAGGRADAVTAAGPAIRDRDQLAPHSERGHR